jgi:hypothetical protein
MALGNQPLASAPFESAVTAPAATFVVERISKRRWSWTLRSADEAAMATSGKTFTSAALAVADATVVRTAAATADISNGNVVG